jgi:hypothetical protein
MIGLDIFNARGQLRKAKEICKRNPSINKVVFGHTHERRIVPFYVGDKLCYLINTGRYNGHVGDFTSINGETGEIVQNKISFKNKIERVRKKLQKKGKIVTTLAVDKIGSKVIKWATASEWSHTSITEGHGRILEQIVSGLQSSPIDKYLDGNHNIIIQDFYDRTNVGKVIKYIHKRIGKRYAFFQLLIDGFYILVKLISGIDLRKEIKYDLVPGRTKCCEEIARAIYAEKNERIKLGVIAANTFPQDFIDNTSLLYKDIEYFIDDEEPKK